MDDLEAMETIENDQNEAIELALDEEMDFNQQVFAHMFDVKNRASPSSSVGSGPALQQQAKLHFIVPMENQKCHSLEIESLGFRKLVITCKAVTLSRSPSYFFIEYTLV